MHIHRDLQHAARSLRRSPGFSMVVILTFALGIGVSTAIFSVVRAVVLEPLDYPEPRQLARITSELRAFGATDTGITAAELTDYRELADVFTGVAGLLPVSANVTSGGTPERVEMLLVSWNYFNVLGVAPVHGRVFGPEDDTAGVAGVAVVSDGFWRRRLDADPQAVGRTVTIDADPILVVGVMPPRFRHPGRTMQADVEVWSPAGFRNPGAPPEARSRRRLEGGLARLRPGVTVEQAQARLAEYGARVTREFPSDYPSQNGWRPRLVPLHDDLVGSVATPMFVLLCGVGLLLLIGCMNVAHLMLARSAGRRHEIAVRRALGASGSRLAAQLASEGALLAAAGGVLGMLVASWTLRLLLALAPARVPRLDQASLDVLAAVGAAVVSLLVTVLFAFGPAWRIRGGEMFAVLKEGGAGRSTDARAGRARAALVAAEVAIATILLVGAGLLVRTVVALLHVPVGFETERLLTARITLPRPNDAARAEYLDPARRVAFAREALRRLEALPGVERLAIASQIPMGGFNPPLFVDLEDREARTARPVVHHFEISPGYFDTVGVPIVRGRSFSDADRAGGDPVAIVSETAARTFWPGRDPIGRRLRFGSGDPWITVVGVAGDVLNRRLTEAPQPILYRPFEQSSDLSFALLVRARSDMTGTGELLAREIRAIDPDLPVYAVRSMADLLESAVAQRTFLMRLLVTFGALATGLALLGIYGVMAYSVSQRTREIAIRMAIGARHTDVARMVLTAGLAVTGAGILAGVVVALALSELIRSQLYGVSPTDPITIGAVLVLMTGVAAAAAWLPARRASRVDPVTALRAE